MTNKELKDEVTQLRRLVDTMNQRFDVVLQRQLDYEKRLGFVEGVQRGKVSVHKFQALLAHLKINIKKNCEIDAL